MGYEIAEQLQAITSVEDEGHLEQLQRILDHISPKQCGHEVITALLGIFERFPMSDGFGVFWSVIHTLEACDGYEPFLVASVNRKPVEFNVLMINRLINGGIEQVNGQNLLRLLQSVASNDQATPAARDSARDFVEFQLEGGVDA